jgi:DNA ligase-1
MLKLFNQVAQLGSPTEKMKLIKAYPYQEELKTVLKLALDPFITFGITDFDTGVDPSGEDPYTVLNQLANRDTTGGAAKRALGAAVDPSDRELFLRIIRKDLRCGVGEKLVLQMYPGLLRQFNVMRAKDWEGLSPRGHYYIEPKMDGLRGLTMIENQTVTIFSRNGNPITSCEHLKPQLLRIAKDVGDCIFDGELIQGNFNQSSSAIRKKDVQNEDTNYHIFDFLDLDEWKNPVKSYIQRRRSLECLVQTSGNLVLTPSHPVATEADAMRFYQQFLDCGYEGGIVKNANGLYRFKKHKDWMKLKEQGSVDLVVESLIQGEGKYYGMLGAAVVKFKGRKVNVGSGWSDDERRLYWKDPTLLVRKVIEVHYHQITPDGSLRHPRFHTIRHDKSI